jgi:molecular chaperone IbpA
MTTLTTLFPRLSPTIIGFDDLFRQFETWETASTVNYPPHNLIKLSDNEWMIELAVAGFSREDLNVTLHYGTLTVESVRSESSEEESARMFLHKGISTRSFRKNWKLNEYVEVSNVEMKDGILRIKLTRDVPEAEKPRQIPIG